MAHSIGGKRVAVVGSGISGLSSAWLLHRSGATVTLFEAEETCGGHTLTDSTSPFPVDLGFQVYNLTTYPNLVGFLEALGVDTEPSDMSFSLSMDGGRLEWGSVGDLDTVFAQRKNLLSPSFLWMVAEVVRFGRQAPEVLHPSKAARWQSVTLEEYLRLRGYSRAFRQNYILPMCAAVWSTPNSQVLAFPVQTLVRFWVNHHLLDLTQRPCWRVVKGRAQQYVKKVLEELPDVRTGAAVTSVERTEGGSDGSGAAATLRTADGGVHEFDAVVFATHSDVTLAILGEGATAEERELLGAIPYSQNDVYLHTDEALMPRNHKAWSSWNVLASSKDGDGAAACVTYWLNLLQNLPPEAPQMFVTLNPPTAPAPEKTLRRLAMQHPVFSFASAEAQRRLPALQGSKGTTYFAGAWAGYGFHEDGLNAGIAAATALGATVPWTPITTSPKVSVTEALYLWMFDRFARASLRTGSLRLILPDGSERLYGDASTTDPPVAAGEEWRGRPPLRATLRVLRNDMFYKVVTRHDTGLGEAFMDGDFLVDDLGGFMAMVVANARSLEGQRGLLGLLDWLGDRLLYLAHAARPNTIAGSRRNISEHYDAGNDMYRLFLDESLTYSAGIHKPGGSLYDAQLAKLDALIQRAGITATDRVLEIGCGWGSLAIRLAQTTGCSVTGITVSKEQLAEATARVEKAGLADKVTLLFCDYRDCPGAGTYDKVLSCEMIEAVGHEHLRPYFATVGAMLRPGGTAVIQAITIPDDRYDRYCSTSDFIREHIFPGGHLPSMGSMVEAARGTGLEVRATADIGPHYAITLREWRQRWEAKRAEVLALGYSARFWNKFRFYFAYCEAAFDVRYIHDLHITWVKATSPAATAATATGRAAAPVEDLGSRLGDALSQHLPSDPLTQVLLAIWFFLTGVILHRSPFLWLLPAVSCLFALVKVGASWATPRVAPFYLRLSAAGQAWWCADIAHLVYSTAAAVASISYVLLEPRSLLLQHPPEQQTVPAVLVCASTGFFAFQLWVSVKHRLFERSVAPIVHSTLLLILFGAAAYKHVHLAFLASTLVAESSSALAALGRLQRLAGVPPAARAARAAAALERGAFLLLRLLPHAALLASLLLNAGAFAARPHFWMAAGGMAAVNVANLARAADTFWPRRAAPKPHEA